MMEPANESYFEPNDDDGIEFAPDLPAHDDRRDDDEERLVPPPSDPVAVARAFVAERYTGESGACLLRHHRGSFHFYADTHWPDVEDRRIRSLLYRWLERALYFHPKDGPTPWEPNRYRIANVVEALQAVGHVAETVQPPAWLGDDGALLVGRDVVPMANGLLDLEARELLPHQPAFFSANCLPFDFDSNSQNGGSSF